MLEKQFSFSYATLATKGTLFRKRSPWTTLFFFVKNKKMVVHRLLFLNIFSLYQTGFVQIRSIHENIWWRENQILCY